MRLTNEQREQVIQRLTFQPIRKTLSELGRFSPLRLRPLPHWIPRDTR